MAGNAKSASISKYALGKRSKLQSYSTLAKLRMPFESVEGCLNSPPHWRHQHLRESEVIEKPTLLLCLSDSLLFFKPGVEEESVLLNVGILRPLLVSVRVKV